MHLIQVDNRRFVLLSRVNQVHSLLSRVDGVTDSVDAEGGRRVVHDARVVVRLTQVVDFFKGVFAGRV